MEIGIKIMDDIGIKISTEHNEIKSILYLFYKDYINKSINKYKYYLTIQYSEKDKWIIYNSKGYFSYFNNLIDVLIYIQEIVEFVLEEHASHHILLHGSCFSAEGMAVGFIGPTHSGKSTINLAYVLEYKDDFINDDMIIVGKGNTLLTFPQVIFLRSVDIFSYPIHDYCFLSDYSFLRKEYIYAVSFPAVSSENRLVGIFNIIRGERYDPYVQSLESSQGFERLLFNLKFTKQVLEDKKKMIPIIETIPIFDLFYSTIGGGIQGINSILYPEGRVVY